MKKLLIGSIVGGIIIFIWQFLSWQLLSLHGNAYQYTDKQDALISAISTQALADGQYVVPSVKHTASMDEMNAAMKTMEGKPWAIISYHSSFHVDMVSNMIRGAIVNIVLVALFCWIIARFSMPRFGIIFIAALFVGLIGFLNIIYTNHIWYHYYDLMAYLVDALVIWGAMGIWLGWLYSRKAA